ncbi:MAG: DUF3604 domain-containing protein, partial [Armatimonadota bacterium]
IGLIVSVSAAAFADLPEWTEPAKPPNFAVRVIFGQGAEEVADYSGKATVTPGTVVKVEGWHFEAADKITGVDTWQCKSLLRQFRKVRPDEAARGRKQPKATPLPVGVLVYVDAPPEATLSVQIPQGTFEVKLAGLKYGKRVRGLNGVAIAERIPISTRLTTGPAMHDYASILRASNGDLYVAWLSWEPDADQALARRQRDGQWGPVMKLSPRPGDNFETQIAEAGDGSIWVVWSSRRATNWDLWGRRVDGPKPGKAVRLTTDPGAEFYHALTSDAQGRLWLAWQAARNGQYDVYLKSYENGKWGDEIRISESPANDWEPAVVADSTGRVYVAWDSYRNGNYDIFLRTLENGKLSAERQITSAPQYEAHACLAVDRTDRLWMSWEQGGVLWGKDQGFLVKARGFSRLHSPRTARIVCMEGGNVMEPEKGLADALPKWSRNRTEFPEVFFDGEGRLWVIYRRAETKSTRGTGRTMWHNYAAYWDGQDWRTDIWIPYTVGREDVRLAALPSPDGGLTMAWASDERPWRNPIPGNYSKPGANNIYMASIAADAGTADLPALKRRAPMAGPIPTNLHPNEAADIQRRREVRWTVAGTQYRLLTGETHRHTDVSFDGGGDSTMYDMMRYEIDAVAQEFIAAWDHDNGGGQDYSWWRSQKLADLFFIDDVFEPLYGYERSVGYPDGHRNVTFAKRGVRCFPRQQIPNPNKKARRKFILSPDDTKKLYEYLRVNNGICFSHTSATNMGTDWRDNDPEVEPVVEIYQGCRTSYEYEGAPKAATADNVAMQIGGWRPAGFVWNALGPPKNYRLGIMAASDHGSTHISYAGVWATEFSREAIFNAFKRRHCFGATDNRIVMFGVGDHMMGDEFDLPAAQPLEIRVIGTAPISVVEVIKDNKIVHSKRPDNETNEMTLKFLDNEAQAGATSYYYVRAQQTDEQIAWSSPLWITYR